jgi:hypothetical protein
MRPEARDWLPPGAIDGAGVRDRVADAVGDWSARWFAASRVQVSDLVQAKGGARDDADGDWRVHRGGIALRQSRMMSQRLQEQALGQSFDGLLLSEVDRRVLAGFSQALMSDLTESLEILFGLTGEARPTPAVVPDLFGPQGGFVFTLSDGRDPLLSVGVPAAAMVALAKSALPPPPRPARPGGTLVAALASTGVTLEACLGRADLSLAEVRDLARGDVIVLDTALNDGGEITLSGEDAPFLHAALGHLDGHLALTILARTHSSIP